MATKPRARSESGFYHVFQRGVCLFDIFEDDDDRDYYLAKLTQYAGELGAEIHAWCLMSNHVHLLLRAKHEALSVLMRKLGSVYARHFNARHCRSGPLFEGRFGSVCIETDSQFMAVVRYIHRNPSFHDENVAVENYQWSSYGQYSASVPKTCKTDFALSLFGGIDRFRSFHEPRRDQKTLHERMMDIGTSGPMKDDEARCRANAALESAGFSVSVSQIGTLSRDQRDKALAYVRRMIGCSLRQLQRLTALAYSVIRQAVGAVEKGAGEEGVNRALPAAESRTAELMRPFGMLPDSSFMHAAFSNRALPSFP
ncbi:MAG: transposase [Eggerthellaceae bacterium]|nr:transposase [Eggerthellaceae bacterium]